MAVPFPDPIRPPLRVLAVGGLRDVEPQAVGELARAGLDAEWRHADDHDDLTQGLSAAPDVVLLRCPADPAVLDETVRRVRAALPHAPLIVLADEVPRDAMRTLLHGGVTDLVFTDDLERLGSVVATALRSAKRGRRDREALGLHHQWAMLLSGLVHHSSAAICVRDRTGVPLVTNARYDDLVRQGLAEQAVGMPAAAPSCREIEVGGSTLMAQSFPVVGAAGLPVAHGLILMDITERKRIEGELRAARAGLECQAAELRASNENLLELDRLKTDLVSTVSHELRTPLTSIYGYTELLADQFGGESDGTARRMIDVIARNSQRLLGLIDNLLVLARLDGVDEPSTSQGPATGPPQVADLVDVVALVDNVVAAIAPTAATAGLQLVVEAASSVPVVLGDAEQLERAVLNLACNAVKFSTRGGQVSIRLAARDGEVVIEVVDQGIGIAQDELPHLGVRFFRGGSARSEQVPGSGLGLSVVHAVARLHGGCLEIESRLGEGTTVRLRLPAPELAPTPVPA